MEPRDKPFQGDGDIHLNDEFIVIHGGTQGARLGFDLVEGIANGRVINVSGLSEFGASCVAAEKLNSQALFQGFYLVAYGRAGNSKFPGGKPETAKSGRSFKSGQST